MPTDLSGKIFGSYKLVAQLGRGGMGTVYRGYQKSIDRSVAVKVMAPGLSHDGHFTRRFLAEARTLDQLMHASILPLYDFGTANDMLYLVMPLMPNGTLGDRLGEGPLALNEVVRVLTPIAAALDYGHGQGVLHRDIKPSNILFDRHDEPLLADFGIAKALEATTGLTTTGVLGTPDYMSPEQARGETLGGQSDQYSLGVVVYQCLTGKALFKATTPLGVMYKHASEPAPRLRAARPDLPEAVEVVVQRSLAKNPKDRYRTVSEFMTALVTAGSGNGISIDEPGAGLRLLSVIRDLLINGLLAVVSGVSIGATVFAAVWLYNYLRARGEMPPVTAATLVPVSVSPSMMPTLIPIVPPTVPPSVPPTVDPTLDVGLIDSARNGFASIVASSRNSCVLGADGVAQCWGTFPRGMNSANSIGAYVPVGLGEAGAIAVSEEGLCAVVSDGKVMCLSLDSAGFVAVAGLEGATAIAAGYSHACAIVAGGLVKCWGRNYWAQLGDGTTVDRAMPVVVVGLAGVIAIGSDFESCALVGGGIVKCWGGMPYGSDRSVKDRATPMVVGGVEGARAIAKGALHACVIVSGGVVQCWGGNWKGQLGDATRINRSTPLAVVGLEGATAIAAGLGHACAIVAGGLVHCWGNNENGQLGDGTIKMRLTPVVVAGLEGVTAIAAGGNHTCVIVEGGVVQCWGNNERGQLGDGTIFDRLTPVVVQGLR